MRFQPNKRELTPETTPATKPSGFSYFIEYDQDGNEFSIDVQSGIESLLGIKEKEIIAQLGWRERIEKRHLDAYSVHRVALKEGKVGLSAYLIKHDGGKQSWVVDSARPVWDDNNNFYGAEGTLIDLESNPEALNYLEGLINLGRQ